MLTARIHSRRIQPGAKVAFHDNQIAIVARKAAK